MRLAKTEIDASNTVNGFSNPFLDMCLGWVDFSVKYQTAVYNATLKATESFFNVGQKPRTEKSIENDIRMSFDTSLQQSLKDDIFVSSLIKAIDAFVNLQGMLLTMNNFTYGTNLISYWNNKLEFLRTTLYRTPSEIIKTSDNFDLLHYKSSTKKYKTPILVVGSLINRYYILDLLPKFSVIRNLLDQGFDVYATEWNVPTDRDHDMTLEDYVYGFLGSAVDKVKETSGTEQVSLLGYCWGGIFALIYSAIHPEDVKNLVLHSTPIDSAANPTPIEIWTSHLNTERDLAVLKNMPAFFINMAFLMRSPLEPFLKWPKFFSEPRSMDEVAQFLTIETWLYDSRPILGGVYKKIVNDIYKENLLIKNKMKMGAESIDLGKITMPVLTIIGNRDDLVPPESSKAVMDVIPSKDKELIEFPSGHTGLCVSTRAHEQLWPRVGKWIAQHSM